MGYYMRYVVAEPRTVSVGDIETFFAGLGADYTTEGEEDEVVVEHRGEPIAHVTLNVPGDDIFEDEVEELREFADDADDGSGKARVMATLKGARQIIAAQVLMGGRDTDDVLTALEPFWAWLFAGRQGLMQADGEGWYTADEQILEVE